MILGERSREFIDFTLHCIHMASEAAAHVFETSHLADKKRLVYHELMISGALKSATKGNLLVDDIANDSPYTPNNVLA